MDIYIQFLRNYKIEEAQIFMINHQILKIDIINIKNMVQKKLTEYSLDELIMKERHHRVILNILISITMLLFILIVILYIQRGFTPIVAILFAEVPIIILYRSRHNEIKVEIACRK